jgi:GT2 family glycosyltransferase
MRADPGNSLRRISGREPGLRVYDADIIILSHDRLFETIDAVRSALAQRGASIHVTLLDQGSSEDHRRVLRQTFAGAPDFAFYAVDGNLGVAGGRNLAASLGQGQVIIALDNDAVFQGSWVAARAVRAMRQAPDLGAIGFCILNAAGTMPDPTGWGYPARLLPRHKDRFDVTTFVGAGCAIRRATWDAVGGYDPAFFFTWEEYDFCLKAIALNWRIRYDGSLAVLHRVAAEARVAWDAARMTYFVRNRLIIGRKWGLSWWRLSPRIAGYCFKGWRYGLLTATLRGIRAAREADPPARHAMPPAMRQYVHANEMRHRGSWFDRLRLEVFGKV